MAANQQDPQKRQGHVPRAPHGDAPAKPAEPPDTRGLGVDPHPREGHVPKAPHAGGADTTGSAGKKG